MSCPTAPGPGCNRPSCVDAVVAAIFAFAAGLVVGVTIARPEPPACAAAAAFPPAGVDFDRVPGRGVAAHPAADPPNPDPTGAALP